MHALNQTFCISICSIPHVNYHIPVTTLLPAWPQLQGGAEQLLLFLMLQETTFIQHLLAALPGQLQPQPFCPATLSCTEGFALFWWVNIEHVLSYVWRDLITSFTVPHCFYVPYGILCCLDDLNPAQFSYATLKTYKYKSWLLMVSREY